MANNRTKNVLINTSVGIGAQVFALVLNFINRTFFIKLLNTEYLGINGLFSNVLSVLSFAELGLGTIIGFYLYKPLAEQDNHEVCRYMAFYKKTYTIIGIIVGCLGVAFIPFLHYTIKEAPNIKENLTLIYLLFLLNTVISYFNVYKKALFQADQKEYLTVLCQRVINLLQLIGQLFVLLLTHNYIFYLLIQVFCTWLDNYVVSRMAINRYPFLTNMTVNHGLSKTEVRSFILNVKAGAIKKVSSILLNSTDNIIISSLLGLTTVGLYSNYLLILNSIGLLTTQICNAMSSSVGNLNASSDRDCKESVFYEILLFTFIIFGFCSIEYFYLVNPFVSIWVGDQYSISQFCVCAIVLNFFISNTDFAAYSFRYTAGFFREYQYVGLLSSLLNIFLSVVLCNYFGLFGVIIATSISRLVSGFWIDPFIVFVKIFHKSPKLYFIRYLTYVFGVLLTGAVVGIVDNLFPPPITYFEWVIRGIIDGICILTCFFTLWGWTVTGKKLLQRIFSSLLRGQ